MRHLDTFVLIILVLVFGLGIAIAQTMIEPGETISGTLTADEPIQEYIFNGKAGDTISVMLSSRMFDTYLKLLPAAGSGQVFSNDDFGGSLNSTIENITLPEDGDYIIEVSSATPDGTGDYELELVVSGASTIAYGDVVEGSVTPNSPEVNYEFEGEAGDTVLISMVSSEFDTFIDLRDSNFFGLISDDDGGDNTNSLIIGYTLPETGTYVINARGYTQQAEGMFELQLQTIDVTPLEDGTPVTAEFNDDTHVYTFEARTGDYLNLDVLGDDGLDTSIILRSPEGYLLTTDDDSGDNLNPELHHFWVESTGQHTLIVQSVSDNTGRYEVSLELIDPITIECGVEETMNFSAKIAGYVFSFDPDEDTDYEMVMVGGEDVYGLATRLVQDGSFLSFDEAQTSLFEYDITPLQESDADFVLYNFNSQTSDEIRIIVNYYDYRNETFTLELVCV